MKKNNIKNKLFSIYIFAILLPLIIITFFLLKNMNNLLMSNYYVQLGYENKFVTTLLNNITSGHFQMSKDLIKDERLNEILSTNYSESYVELYSDILFFNSLKNIKEKPEVDSIFIYTNNESLDTLNDFTFIDDDIKNSLWFQKASKQATGFYTTWSDNEAVMLSYFQKLPMPLSDDFAILQINTSNNYLFNQLQEKYTEIFISVNDDELFYKSNDWNGKVINQYIHENSPNITTSELINGKKVLLEYFKYKPYLTDDIIKTVIIDPNAIYLIEKISAYIIIILAITFSCTTIIVYIFTTKFTSRLKMLQISLENSLNGNYKISEYLEGSDEVSIIFNNIKKLIIKIMEKEEQIHLSKLNEQKLITEQQKIEFKMLSSQINPHFLYNTLETIRMNALVSGNKEVANSIKLLGKSLRYVLENTTYNTTQLKKEIEYINTYLQIQKMRFKDKINFELNIDETIDLEINILPLIIQPIIENSINHGLGNKSSINIFLNIEKKEDDEILITIIDDGVGANMGKDSISKIVHKINDSEENAIENSIGLRNINKRLKIYYKSDGLKLKSDEEFFYVSFSFKI